MENNKWMIGLVVAIAVIGLVVWGFGRVDRSAKTEPNVAGIETETPNYFAQDAKVMYFYSDECHYCVLQKPILTQLGEEGYRFKPMNVGKDPSLWKTYNVEGTPTFIAENNDRLVGYQKDKEVLKAFLDAHR